MTVTPLSAERLSSRTLSSPPSFKAWSLFALVSQYVLDTLCVFGPGVGLGGQGGGFGGFVSLHRPKLGSPPESETCCFLHVP